MKRTCAQLIGLAVLVGALGALASAWAASASAANTVPCWKRLLNDWYDGTINKVYPIPCYQQAIKHLPPETEIYGSAKEDIERAEQAAISHKTAPPEQGATTINSTGAETPPQTTTTQTTSSPKQKKHGISGALADITPGDPQAFPLPLLILGALAILLILAGAAGMLWQRSHPRDEPPAAA